MHAIAMRKVVGWHSQRAAMLTSTHIVNKLGRI
jgi:hypothetical protein